MTAHAKQEWNPFTGAADHKARLARIAAASKRDPEPAPKPPTPPIDPLPLPVALPPPPISVPWFQIVDASAGRVTVNQIQLAVAQNFGLSRCDLISSRRTANVVVPRQIAMYLAKELTLRSLPDIGKRFGGRDHTTVLHAVRKMTRLVTTDAELAGRIDGLRRELGEME